MTGMIGDTEASSPGSVFYPYQTRWCLGTLQVPITAHLETQGLMTLWVPVQKSMAPMPSAGRTPRRLQEEGASLTIPTALLAACAHPDAPPSLQP